MKVLLLGADREQVAELEVNTEDLAQTAIIRYEEHYYTFNRLSGEFYQTAVFGRVSNPLSIDSDGKPRKFDNDAAIAVGEEAFRAGYKSAADRARAFHPQMIEDDAAHLETAWSDYEPSENVKALVE